MLKYNMSLKEKNIGNTRDFGNEIFYIIQDMNLKRNRFRNLSTEEIHTKLFSKDLQKPGEYFEFMEEYEASGGRLTPDLSLEIADIIYYTSQPNASEEDKKLATQVENMSGIDHKLAQQFCILKYSYRAYDHKANDDYKKIEREIMVRFLNNRNLNILE
jgi:hypothetical protein